MKDDLVGELFQCFVHVGHGLVHRVLPFLGGLYRFSNKDSHKFTNELVHLCRGACEHTQHPQHTQHIDGLPTRVDIVVIG